MYINKYFLYYLCVCVCGIMLKQFYDQLSSEIEERQSLQNRILNLDDKNTEERVHLIKKYANQHDDLYTYFKIYIHCGQIDECCWHKLTLDQKEEILEDFIQFNPDRQKTYAYYKNILLIHQGRWKEILNVPSLETFQKQMTSEKKDLSWTIYMSDAFIDKADSLEEEEYIADRCRDLYDEIYRLNHSLSSLRSLDSLEPKDTLQYARCRWKQATYLYKTLHTDYAFAFVIMSEIKNHFENEFDFWKDFDMICGNLRDYRKRLDCVHQCLRIRPDSRYHIDMKMSCLFELQRYDELRSYMNELNESGFSFDEIMDPFDFVKYDFRECKEENNIEKANRILDWLKTFPTSIPDDFKEITLHQGTSLFDE